VKRQKPVDNLFKLLLALLLVFLTAFFVAAELALVKVRTTRLDELATRKVFGAERALEASRHISHYLHATKFGVMVCAVVLGSVGHDVVHGFLGPVLHSVPDWVSTVLIMVIVTLVEFVLGELVPTTMAIKDAEKILLATIVPLDIFYRVCKHPLAAMGKLSSLILRPFGYKTDHSDEESISEAEIRLIVEQSGEGGALGEEEVGLVHRVLDFAHRQAKEIMVPRPDIVFLSTDKPLAENRKIAENSGYTRFPLCEEGSTDEIIGMIHIRDLLRFKSGDLLSIVIDLPRVPETKPIDQLLRELQRQRQHMAVVVDEFGGTEGIVTLEDILEEIVGDIMDERDPTRPEIESGPEGTSVVDGRMPLEKLERLLELTSPEEEPEVETVGGWVLTQTNGSPRVGDTVSYSNAQLTVVEMTGRRVRKVRVSVLVPQRTD
jgi:CBS domain containing-hemolysin-like protein